VDYLCKLGHKRIAIITAKVEDESIGKYRLQGYLEALKANNIEVDWNLVKYMHKDIEEYSLENGYACTKEFLEAQLEFTAIFAISDILAIGACRAILDVNKSVPKDYSIIGFDGIELGSYSNPTITTIAQPVSDIGLESTHILFSQIKHKKKEAIHKIYAAQLLERDSCRAI
jgi:DNA-binding LacI/PurR family transcriptional regulator